MVCVTLNPVTGCSSTDDYEEESAHSALPDAYTQDANDATGNSRVQPEVDMDIDFVSNFRIYRDPDVFVVPTKLCSITRDAILRFRHRFFYTAEICRISEL